MAYTQMLRQNVLYVIMRRRFEMSKVIWNWNTKFKVIVGMEKKLNLLKCNFSDLFSDWSIKSNVSLEVFNFWNLYFRMDKIPIELCERKSYRNTLKILKKKYGQNRLDQFIRFLARKRKPEIKLSFDVSIYQN